MPTGTVSHVRQIIKAEEIVNLLQNSLIGENPKPLNQNQINTAKILLAKAIPDLKAIEHSGSLEGEQTHVHRVSFRSKK